MLVGKAQDAIPAEPQQDLPELALAERLRQIAAPHRRAQHRPGWFEIQHIAFPLAGLPRV